jgi:dolichyl-phosphate beta-glucosyltransferase
VGLAWFLSDVIHLKQAPGLGDFETRNGTLVVLICFGVKIYDLRSKAPASVDYFNGWANGGKIIITMSENAKSNTPNRVLQEREVILVVPCYNEEVRWHSDYWRTICKIENLRIYFVNDGSSDKTSSQILNLISDSPHKLLELPVNLGKAEAVRFGLIEALREKPKGIGYLDADGAFPYEDVFDQISLFHKLSNLHSQAPAIWSSRVHLSGRNIDRNQTRHYFSRVLITLLAIRFKFKVYDTQCGLKIFPYSRDFENCLTSRFLTRWFIDIELLLRWRAITDQEMQIWEEPLFGWKDVAQSNLSGMEYFTVIRDVIKLNRYLNYKSPPL